MDTPPTMNAPRPQHATATIVGILSAIIIVGAYVVAANVWNFWPYGAPVMTACTMEAKLCPDGSAVGRSGPNCEFAPCPNSASYTNNQYDFSVALPAGWQGYTIVTGTREIRDVDTGLVVATAPTISVRHPQWTAAVPRQDIPIDIYTPDQWAGITSEKFSVGAAPIPPSELAHNSRYVFALPARYNFAFPVGFQEVETIIAGKPMTVFESPAPSTSESGLSGTVLTGPTCPVVRPDDPNCGDKPYQGQFAVRNPIDATIVARFSTNAAGTFQVVLAPGKYAVEPVVKIGVSNQSQTVMVKAGSMTHVTLTFDTGIR
jgi:hypothetical protein